MGKSKITVPQNDNKQNKIPSNKFGALGSEDENSDDETNVYDMEKSTVEKSHMVDTQHVTQQATEKKSEPIQEIKIGQYKPSFASKLMHEKKETSWNDKPKFIKNDGSKSFSHNKKYVDNKFGDKSNKYESYKHNSHNSHNSNSNYESYKHEPKEQKKMPTEAKKLYIEPTEYCEERENELGNTKFLNSSWTVWIHKANVGPEIENWTEDTYTCIYVINSIGSFWRFYNNFQMLDKINYQYFIMRNKIKPIWEDNDNRNGSICSFRVEYGPCAMTCMSLLIMNETFMTGNDDINGISYSIKNKSILIKVWYKIGTNKVVDKIPIEFMNKLDAFIKNNDKFGKRDNSSITIRYSRIDPKYTLDT